MGAKYIAFYENIGTGIQFDNIRYSPVEGDRFTCFETVIFMLLDTFIHLILMWYIENVYPGRFSNRDIYFSLVKLFLSFLGTYGIPKKWYFPFTISYWTGEKYTEPNWIKKLKNIRIINWIKCRKHHMTYQFHWSTTALNDSGRNQSNKNKCC